jgi:predicted transcriptional regulator of viral defense system
VFDHSWHARSSYRLPDLIWQAAVNRIRAEFEEMPSLRVTLSEARRLFGLPDPAATWVLRRLAREGFLVRTARGEYICRAAHP